MFRAVVRFADLNDGRHIYEAGDEFPRLGLTVDEARLAELSSGKNRAGRPLIQAVPEKKAEKPPKRRVKKNDD